MGKTDLDWLHETALGQKILGKTRLACHYVAGAIFLADPGTIVNFRVAREGDIQRVAVELAMVLDEHEIAHKRIRVNEFELEGDRRILITTPKKQKPDFWVLVDDCDVERCLPTR